MRPFTVSLPAPISDAIAIADGYAVLTERGTELLDLELARRGSIPFRGADPPWRGKLYALPGGRFLVHSTFLWLGTTELACVVAELVSAPRFTEHGFVAAGDGKLWLDEGAGGRWVALRAAGRNQVAAGDRLVLTESDQGVAVIDTSGALLARRAELGYMKGLAIAGDKLAITGFGDELVVLGFPALTDVWKVKTGKIFDAVAHGTNLVVKTADTVQYWELAGDAPRKRWQREATLGYFALVGDRIVTSPYDGRETELVGTSAGTVAEVELGSVFGAAAFGDGIVLCARGGVRWWRPGREPVELRHDVTGTAVTVPAGAISFEGRHLHLWRQDADGPELTTVATTIPFDVPIVVGGTRLRVREARRFELVAEEGDKHVRTIAPDAAWRRAVDATEAKAIVDRLIAHERGDELPPEAETRGELAQRPLAETFALHARALAAPGSLSAKATEAQAFARDAFYGELAAALGLRPRVLIAAVRARQFPLEPPRTFAGYDYLGSFTTGKTAWIADPCYFAKRGRESLSFLATKLDVQEGTWHAYVRNGAGDAANRTAELVAIHTDGFEVHANSEVGSIGVDAGCVGIFDADAPNVNLDLPFVEGIHAGLAAVSWSGYGDGAYPAFAGRVGRKIVKLRVAYLDLAKRDHMVATPTTGRPYSIKERFATGEAIAHPKFGVGTVGEVRADGKIVVAFADGERTLIHAKH